VLLLNYLLLFHMRKSVLFLSRSVLIQKFLGYIKPAFYRILLFFFNIFSLAELLAYVFANNTYLLLAYVVKPLVLPHAAMHVHTPTELL